VISLGLSQDTREVAINVRFQWYNIQDGLKHRCHCIQLEYKQPVLLKDIAVVARWVWNLRIALKAHNVSFARLSGSHQHVHFWKWGLSHLDIWFGIIMFLVL